MQEAISRRTALTLAAAGGMPVWRRLCASTADFWNRKPPSQWSAEEIQRLLNDSPWAKRVTARYAAGEEPVPPAGHSHGTWTEKSPPLPPVGWPRQPGPSGKATASPYKGTLRWESAQPILDAIPAPLPDALANHYVIVVTGIPLSPAHGSPAPDAESLKMYTTLQAHGRAAKAEVVVQEATSIIVLKFGFARQALGLSKKAGEAVFSASLGRLLVEGRFDLREMVYHGQLAV